MFYSRTDIVACFLLFLLGCFVFTQELGTHGLEYRDDEIFYFQSTQEMLETGNVLSPTYFGEDRFQKPILYYWLVLASYKVFGVNWFAARFVAVFFASLTVCLTWLIGRELFNRGVGTLSALILMTVPLFFRHAKNAVPDIVLNFFIVFALYCAIQFFKEENRDPVQNDQRGSFELTYRILFFISCALGFMIKGFIAIIVPFVTVLIYSFLTRQTKTLAHMRFGRGTLIMLAIILPWFCYMIVVHGQTYLDYMLVDETKNRLISEGNGNKILSILTTFMDHVLFYLNVMGSYFSPWCIFLIPAIPLALMTTKNGSPRVKEGIKWMVIWFFVVFCFFSMIYFSISHYILILTTPFAVLISCFFLGVYGCRISVGKVITSLQKHVTISIFIIGVVAFSFLFVFLAGGAKGWLIIFLLSCVWIVCGLYRTSLTMAAPLGLALLILFVFAQSSLLGKAGLTSHAILQNFAATVNQDINRNPRERLTVAVGSHDIHEKEFQVYFDQRVEKVANSVLEETGVKLSKVFDSEDKVYCLMTKKDFDYFRKGVLPDSIEVLQEDYIFRRRLKIDTGFFMAMLRLDQKTVAHYFKEKLVLVRKGRDV